MNTNQKVLGGNSIFQLGGVLALLSSAIIIRQIVKNRLVYFDLITALNLLSQVFLIWFGLALIFSKISYLKEIVTNRKVLIPLVLSAICGSVFSYVIRIKHPPTWVSRRANLETRDSATDAPAYCPHPTSPDPRCWGNH
jgi:hypothetical protein